MTGKIRIGVGGWTYEPWRETFYPSGLRQADELVFASRALTAIEVNGTYYGTQKPATFAKWAKETPEGFVFALKAPRFATARRVLAEGAESISRFLASGLTELGPKLGPINWQLPPTKKFDPADTEAFLDLLPDRLGGQPLTHAIEARHESFDCDDFTRLLRERNIAVVQAEDSEYPRIDAATAPFAYLRIMGTTEAEPLGYSEADIDHWAARLHEMARKRDVFLFVISGHKAANPAAAQALIQRL